MTIIKIINFIFILILLFLNCVAENPLFNEIDIELKLVSSFEVSGSANDIYIIQNYAYVAIGNSGLQVLDISDVYNIKSVKKINTTSYAGTIDVKGSYLYLSNYDNGVLVYDISTLNNPVYISTCSAPPYDIDFIKIYNNYLIGTSQRFGDGSVKIWDVSNPLAPGFVKSIGTTKSQPRQIEINGNYAYVTFIGSGIDIINLSDVTNAFNETTVTTPDIRNILITVNNYLYHFNKIEEIIRIYDVNDPVNWVLIKTGNYPLRYMMSAGIVHKDGFLFLNGESDLFMYKIIGDGGDIEFIEKFVLDNDLVNHDGIAVKDNYIFVSCNNKIKVFDYSAYK